MGVLQCQVGLLPEGNVLRRRGQHRDRNKTVLVQEGPAKVIAPTQSQGHISKIMTRDYVYLYVSHHGAHHLRRLSLRWKVIQDCRTQGFSSWKDCNGRILWSHQACRGHFRPLPRHLAQCLQWYILLAESHRAVSNSAIFSDSASEKPARGTIFTNLQRQLAIDRVLILDSLNYIKGFRYQIYCAARELKLRTCTVHPSPFHT
jgi:hypothetical protein